MPPRASPTDKTPSSSGHASRSDEASDLIVRLLSFMSERRLAAGERLPSERVLAERFGVARAVVREAIAKLEAMRVVECRPRSGVYRTA
jgi:GntR family transcriptional repressor for pyruvate dehydrogenase complex